MVSDILIACVAASGPAPTVPRLAVELRQLRSAAPRLATLRLLRHIPGGKPMLTVPEATRILHRLFHALAAELDDEDAVATFTADVATTAMQHVSRKDLCPHCRMTGGTPPAALACSDGRDHADCPIPFS